MSLLINKRGIEAFPFLLLLTLIIASVVLVVSLYEINMLSELSEKREMSKTYNDFIEAIQNLKISADQGSFINVKIKIAKGYKLSISPEEDQIIVTYGDQKIVNNLNVNILPITITKELKEGEYVIELYYGNFSGTPEPYTLYFI